jgi:hypothetical protein
MNATLKAIILALVLTTPALSQTNDEINRNEFYAGCLNKRSDDSVFSNGANGFQFSCTRNITKYVGVRTEFAGTFKNRSFPTTTPTGTVDFATKSSFYTFHAGIQIKDNSKIGKLKPFAHALVGVAHNRSAFRCTPISTCQPTVPNFTRKETGISAGFGGGLGLRVNNRMDVRLFHIEYNPVRITQHNPVRIGVRNIQNVRFGAAIIIK